MMQREVRYIGRFMIGDRVSLNGSDIIGLVTEVKFTGASGDVALYRAEWFSSGVRYDGQFEDWQLALAVE